MTISRGRKRFGILVPFTNTNLEPDMALLRPEGVSMHFARMGGYDQNEIPDAKQMHVLGAANLDEPLRLLQGVQPDVILYGCTSATLTHGLSFDRELAERIETENGAHTITAAGALVNALKFLGVSRISFASPYVREINDMAIDFLKEAGFSTVHCSEVSTRLDNYGQGELLPEKVYNLGLKADHKDSQAVILSCTDMRSVEVISKLEEMLDKPVISSNQAMMFQAMRVTGIEDSMPGYGKLLRSSRL